MKKVGRRRFVFPELNHIAHDREVTLGQGRRIAAP